MFEFGVLRKNFDYPLFISYCILSVIGILLVYSATYYSETASLKVLYKKQIIWFAISIGLVLLVAAFPFKYLFIFVYGFYAVSVMLLLVVLLFPHSGFVNERWLLVGAVRFQPSEFAKIATVLLLAHFLADTKVDFQRSIDFITPALIVLVPAILVARQPDLGTAIIFGALLFPLFYWAGMRTIILLYIIFPFINIICSFNWISWMVFMCVLLVVLYLARPSLLTAVTLFILNLAVGIVTPNLWRHLHDYQRARILTFLDPEKDPLGAGYQIIQSKVAVGSGGIFGKGYLQGTQIQLAFLPEQHTDFIFSVLGEEFGFLGVVIVMALFFFIIYRGLSIALACHNRFAGFICVGIITIILVHVLVNLGMVVGLMPITGLPLPFLSYGGSSFISFSIMIGLLLGIMARKWEY